MRSTKGGPGARDDRATAVLAAALEQALDGKEDKVGPTPARWANLLDRVRVLVAERTEVPPLKGTEELATVGFRPVGPGQDFHNPLRLHLVMAVRDGRGVWAGIPVMWAPLPTDCEALLALARELGSQPHVARRFVDPTRQNG